MWARREKRLHLYASCEEGRPGRMAAVIVAQADSAAIGAAVFSTAARHSRIFSSVAVAPPHTTTKGDLMPFNAQRLCWL